MLVKAALYTCLLTPAALAAVEFNRDIRPILSDRCFTCHGPDAGTRKIRLRLDSESGMMAKIDGHSAVVPGKIDESELVRRITAEKPALRMPPTYSGLKLTDREIGLFKQWIADGAKWQKHWSFLAPTRPDLPPVSNAAWPKNSIDHFVLARLDRENLKPSPEADRAALLRRVSLDLTGIPPSLQELDAFLADTSPQAYEKAVDHLLQSPRYGERMAMRWLDVSRYADTNGYQTDGERSMWRWRDYVIQSFNQNKPFDQFTIEQLAGDLLPHPTVEQRIATGFNRNHRGNGEGGIVPEEYFVEYSVDRVETMSAAWLGITTGCARCHNHKYDPLTQKDFYSLFAFFNNIPEKGRYFKFGNTPPVIPAPTPPQQKQIAGLDAKVAQVQATADALAPRLNSTWREWMTKLPSMPAVDWHVSRNQALHVPLNKKSFDGSAYHNAGTASPLGYLDSFSISAWVNPASPNGAIITRGKDVIEESGILLLLKDGKLHVSMAARWLDDTLRTETQDSLKLNEWSHVLLTYDGTRIAAGIRIFINGREAAQKVLVDELNQEFRSGEPWRIGGGGGKEFLFKGSIDDVRIYRRVLSNREAEMLAISQNLNQLAALTNRTPAQTEKLRLAFMEDHAEPAIKEAWKNLLDAREKRDQFVASIPTVMVMEELPQPRDSFVLIRGSYEKPGEKAPRAVPASLHPFPKGAPNNRLGLAKWIVSPDNPLTARVLVNRLWQSMFGTGIVKTVEDFGAQGEWPSHPDLLDWLATEYIRLNWDTKALMKTIVMSATYRQTSRVSQELQSKDPENRLLARGPRMRLPAESVRDQALAISGLLVEKIGGPSVKPYQPAGLWKELSGGADYEADKGEGLYRRSLYTFWKRASPPPSMMNFDAAGRETCIVRENRTNTPLQALNLMNDVTYLEAARKIAERMIREGGATPAERIAYGFRLATARAPRDNERTVLLSDYTHQLAYYRANNAEAMKLLGQGDSKRDESLDPSEVAAFSTVASLILNLDETITKQ